MRKVLTILQALFIVKFSALNYGPCHNVTTVNFDPNKWVGTAFINVMTKNAGVRCLWVNKTLAWNGPKPANPTQQNTLLFEFFTRLENGVEVNSTVQGQFVGEGQYKYQKGTTHLMAFWMYFNMNGDGNKEEQMDIHFSCSNDEQLKNGHGAFWVESFCPDASPANACKIKKIAESNGFDINDLMVADNCDCPNIPVQYKSNCKKITIEEYFKNCY